MGPWLYAIVALLLIVPLVWLALRGRPLTVDLDPVSAQWLAEHRRSRGDEPHV